MDDFVQDQWTDLSGQGALPHRVRAAVSYMRSNIAEKVTLTGLAVACSVPERTLLKQFRKFVGLSPLAYLLRLRLNAAREELLDAGRTAPVADIAVCCGFAHLGRFAKVYRSAYGESPSSTRERVRARMANGTSKHSGNDGAPAENDIKMRREKPSLIILPLSTETLKESQEARDLTEQLAAALSRIRVADVTLASPSHRVTTTAPRPRNTGTQYCLTGRLMQRGECTRVVVRLIDTDADHHLWGDSFDGTLNEPFALRDRVVDCVLSNVVATITDAEIGRACDKDPGTATACDLALRALPLIMDSTLSGTRKAIAILTHATEFDPINALAVALLGACHAHLAFRYGTTSPALARAQAMQLSARAAILDSADPLVTVARAATAFWTLRQDEADALAARAIAQDPTSAWAWERRGMARLFSGGDPRQAIADFNRALRLRGPSLSRINCLTGIAGAHHAAGQMADALLWRRKALAENPTATWLYGMDACTALEAGDWSRFLADVECMRHGQPELSVTLLRDSYPPVHSWILDAFRQAGMPLT